MCVCISPATHTHRMRSPFPPQSSSSPMVHTQQGRTLSPAVHTRSYIYIYTFLLAVYKAAHEAPQALSLSCQPFRALIFLPLSAFGARLPPLLPGSAPPPGTESVATGVYSRKPKPRRSSGGAITVVLFDIESTGVCVPACE